jgi:hypothetical protein
MGWTPYGEIDSAVMQIAVSRTNILRPDMLLFGSFHLVAVLSDLAAEQPIFTSEKNAARLRNVRIVAIYVTVGCRKLRDLVFGFMSLSSAPRLTREYGLFTEKSCIITLYVKFISSR